jgi:hypothetical protein
MQKMGCSMNDVVAAGAITVIEKGRAEPEVITLPDETKQAVTEWFMVR